MKNSLEKKSRKFNFVLVKVLKTTEIMKQSTESQNATEI